MKFVLKHLTAGVAALAMAATPVAASAHSAAGSAASTARANPAAGLSVGAARTGSTPANVSALRGDRSVLINLGIFAVIVVGILVATTTGGGDDDTPDSP